MIDSNFPLIPTAEQVGAAPVSHGAHVTYSTDAPMMDGTATAGTAATVAHSDHTHPVDTSRAAADHTHTASQTGAMCTPTILVDNTDLNNITTPGFYYCPANATVATFTNCPTSNAFFLEVGRHAGTYQRLVEYMTSGARILFRNYYNSWGAWAREYSTTNKPTAAEVGALPLAGGTITGNINVKTANYTSTPVMVTDSGNTYGQLLRIQAGGDVVIGSGESAGSLISALGITGQTENLHLGSDGNITLYTNCNTIANRKAVVINTAGGITAPGGFSGALTGGATFEAIKNIEYNLNSLMLQNYYDGKYTAFKKALVFDGFQNSAMITSVTAGAYHDVEAKTVRILKTGATTINTGFAAPLGNNGTGDYYYKIGWVGAGGSRELDFTPSGYGKLNSVKMRMCKGSTDTVYVQVDIMDGKTVIATSNKISVASTAAADYTFTFSGGVQMLGLHTYQIKVYRADPEKYYLMVSANSTDNGLGAVFSFTAQNYTTGNIISKVVNITQNYTKALGWVRHTGGTISLYVKGNSGDYVSMPRTSTRSTTNLQGQSCTESMFELTAVPATPNNNVTVKLAMDTGSGACTVYDYGIAFI